MNDFREMCSQLAEKHGERALFDRERNVLEAAPAGQKVSVRESGNIVVLEMTNGEEKVSREFELEESYKVLSGLLEGSAVACPRFTRKPEKRKSSAAAKIVGIIIGSLIALLAGFCAFAVLVAYLDGHSSEPLLTLIAMELFFVGIMAAGIALAWSCAKGKLTAGRFFGVGGGFVMANSLLSLILGIWSSRAWDNETPIDAYIALTIVFGIFIAGGIALMIYNLAPDKLGKLNADYLSNMRQIEILPSEENAGKLLAAARERTRREAIRVSLDFGREPSILDSKIGGLPYWDGTKPYPCADDGEKLVMLAQFNLSQLPKNSIFPSEGMVQFFIKDDMEYCLDGGAKVIYHSVIDRGVYEKTVTAMGIPCSTDPDVEHFPVTGQFAVSFKLCGASMNSSDGGMDDLLRSLAEEMGIELYDAQRFIADQLEGITGDDADDGGETLNTGHWLAGYPYFTQYDSRSDEERSRYDMMLFQLDSQFGSGKDDREIMWGDAGVCNFFVNSDAFGRMELDDIYYTWDCC